jgi:hypothetical protein
MTDVVDNIDLTVIREKIDEREEAIEADERGEYVPENLISDLEWQLLAALPDLADELEEARGTITATQKDLDAARADVRERDAWRAAAEMARTALVNLKHNRRWQGVDGALALIDAATAITRRGGVR